jgi:NTE family protein
VAPREWSVITPDPQALTDFGRNLPDPARRPPAARSGLRQSENLVDEVAHVWTS